MTMRWTTVNTNTVNIDQTDMREIRALFDQPTFTPARVIWEPWVDRGYHEPPYEPYLTTERMRRLRDPITLRSLRCLYHDCTSWARYPENGMCRDHGMCNRCGALAVTLPMYNDGEVRLCARCRCHKCGDPDPTKRTFDIDENGREVVVRLCVSCFSKNASQKGLCRKCQRNRATVKLRGGKDPALCVSCVAAHGPASRNTHYCTWCRNRASSHYGGQIACRECRGKNSCLANGCTPTTLCRDCADRVDRERATQEAMTRLTRTNIARNFLRDDLDGYYHEDPNGERLDPNSGKPCRRECPACNNIVRRHLINAAEQHHTMTRFYPADKLAQRRENPSRRMLGIEVEVCGLTYPIRIPNLRKFVDDIGGVIVYDGSLPAGGFEIPMPPAAGDNFTHNVDRLCEELKAVGAWVNTTYGPYDRQAGLHVHVDVRDHTYSDMRKLLIRYANIEPALIRTQPFSRVMEGQDDGHGRRRMYCVPCGERYRNGILHLAQPKPMKARLIDNVYGRGAVEAPPRTEHRPRANVDVRYFALNVHSWFYRGTIECRLHTGTVDPNEIKWWGMLWANIVDQTYRATDKEVVAETGKDPLALLLSLAPTRDISNYITSRVEKFAAEWKNR